MRSEIERATQLEDLLPRVIRSLFRAEHDDEWVELPVGQVRVLRYLFSGPSTPSELGNVLGLSVSAITQVVNRLESLGYVTRTEDRADRRIRHLKLTEAGQTLMINRQQARVRQALQVLATLPEERQESILDHLQELADAGSRAPRTPEFSPLMAEFEQPLLSPRNLQIQDTA